MRESESSSARVTALRRAFDATFAVPPPRVDPGSGAAFLVIRVAQHECAVRLQDIRGLTADKRIVPVPALVPELLGLIGMRGAVVPVYSLANLLGAAAERTAPRWIVLVGDDELVGLGFEGFQGYLSVAREAVYPATSDHVGRWVSQVVRADETTRAVIETRAMVAAIRSRGGEG